MKKNILWLFLVLLLVCQPVFAEEAPRYYLGNAVNAGKDTGYAEENPITEGDPHFGWELGRFYVSGYTRVTEGETPIFLKNAGDRVTLWFSLEQDIQCLNGQETLTVCADENGFDQEFAVGKTNFGHGTLMIRHTDYQNQTGTPTVYTDYLSANLSPEADVEVELFEEGDYEVALDYELRKETVDIMGWKPFDSYYDYRISFRFSVRNGNCMVFPMDVATGAELSNASTTENGFYLDLAKSRYLDIDIKKEVLTEGSNGLTEDVRFHRPAKDGDQYTDEGIYTVTVKNRYTGMETEKVIYVGTDPVLKTHVTTGMPIPEIQEAVENGAVFALDGTMTAPEEAPQKNHTVLWISVGVGVLLLLFLLRHRSIWG